MKQTLSFILIILTFSVAYSQETITRKIKRFKKVVVHKDITLEIDEMESSSIEITSWDFDPKKIVLTVDDYGLNFKVHASAYNGLDSEFRKPVVKISNRRIESVTLKEGAELVCQDTIKSVSFILAATGANVSKLKLNTERFIAKLGAQQNIEVSGKASLLNLFVGSDGNFEGVGLASDKIIAELNNNASATVFAISELKAILSKDSKLYYQGTPTLSGHTKHDGLIKIE